MWEAVLRWAVSFVLGSLATWAITTIKHHRKKEKAEEAGVCCLLRAYIIEQNEKWVKRGFCPVYAKEALKRAYASYEAMGGNDVGTRLYEETMALPENPKGKK